jgi:hypothetical protein
MSRVALLLALFLLLIPGYGCKKKRGDDGCTLTKTEYARLSNSVLPGCRASSESVVDVASVGDGSGYHFWNVRCNNRQWYACSATTKVAYCALRNVSSAEKP